MQGTVPKLAVEAEFTIRTTKSKYKKRHGGLRCNEYPNDKSKI
jgi:hypothetical protein